MKKRIVLSLAGIFLSITASFSQSIDLPTDSITALLCSKWEINYALIGGIKIGRMPGAEEINYEFKKDRTLILTGKNPNDKVKGTWAYDPKKKVIRLTTNGQSNSSIISLRKGELIVLLDKNKGMPADMGDAKIVYKIKTEY